MNPNTEYIPYGSFLLNKLPIYTEWSKLLDMLPKSVHDKYLSQRKVKVWIQLIKQLQKMIYNQY